MRGRPLRLVGIVGGHLANTTEPALHLAEAVGEELARRGYGVVCGGFDGVMEAACRGAKRAGGTTVGILKGNDWRAGNAWLDIPILTSMDVACNNVLVWTAMGLIGFDGRYGTLNELALALDFGRPLVTVGRHELLNVAGVRSTRFSHFEGYDLALVPEVVDRLEALMKEAHDGRR